MDAPRTRYARNGPVHLAYQVVGDRPPDLLFITSWIAHIEHLWAEPHVAESLRRLSSFSRLILFDRRGSGMSDRLPFASLEEQMDDLRAVLAAAGAPRAHPPPQSEGGGPGRPFAPPDPPPGGSGPPYSPVARLRAP